MSRLRFIKHHTAAAAAAAADDDDEKNSLQQSFKISPRML